MALYLKNISIVLCIFLSQLALGQQYYRGLLDNKYPITLCLEQNNNSYSGFYFYDKYKTKIQLRVTNTNGQLTCLELKNKSPQRNHLKLNIKNDAILNGYWSDDTKQLEVVLYKTENEQSIPASLLIPYLNMGKTVLTTNNNLITESHADDMRFQFLPKQIAVPHFIEKIPKYKQFCIQHTPIQNYKRSKKHLEIGQLVFQHDDWHGYLIKTISHKGHNERQLITLVIINNDGQIADCVVIQEKTIEERTGHFMAQETNTWFNSSNSFFVNQQVLTIKYSDTLEKDAFYKETPSQTIRHFKILPSGILIELVFTTNNSLYEKVAQKLTIQR